MEYKQYLEFTHDNDYIELYRYYSTETIFDIMNVSRQENPHSSFIRWLLDNHSGHAMGDMPMRKFIETIGLMKEKGYGGETIQPYVNRYLWQDEKNLLSKKNKELFEELIYGRCTVKDISIANEVVLGKQRRADIVQGADGN